MRGERQKDCSEMKLGGEESNRWAAKDILCIGISKERDCRDSLVGGKKPELKYTCHSYSTHLSSGVDYIHKNTTLYYTLYTQARGETSRTNGKTTMMCTRGGVYIHDSALITAERARASANSTASSSRANRPPKTSVPQWREWHTRSLASLIDS